jgi:hypothetical protein
MDAMHISALCSEFLAVFEAALSPGEGSAIFDRAADDVICCNRASNNASNFDPGDQSEWRSVIRKGKGSKHSAPPEPSFDASSTTAPSSRDIAQNTLSDVDWHRIQQRAVDEALNLVLLQSELTSGIGVHGSSNDTLDMPPALQQHRSDDEVQKSYASAAAARLPKPSGSSNKATFGSTHSRTRAEIKPLSSDRPPYMSHPHASAALAPSSVSAAVGNKDAKRSISESPSINSSSLSLIQALDVSQQRALESLQSLFEPHVEVSYLIDLLFTYNFDVASATWALYEDIDKKRTYKNAAMMGGQIRKHSFLKPPPPPITLGFQYPSKIEEIMKQNAKINQVSAGSNVYVSMFGWTRALEDANECKGTVQRLNPLLLIEIDPRSGQLMYCGIKSKRTGSESAKKSVSNAIQNDLVALSRGNATFVVNMDLHTLTVRQALELTYSAIDYYLSGRDRSRNATQHSSSDAYSRVDLVLVPGRGLHSPKGYSVLMLALQRYLHRFGYDYDADAGRGTIYVHMRRKPS